MVRYLSDRIGVMYLGKLVEIGPADRCTPTRCTTTPSGLLDTIPVADPAVEAAKRGGHRRRTAIRDRPALRLPVPHPLPGRAVDLREGRAEARAYGPDNHLAACHLPLRPAAAAAEEVAPALV